MPNVQLLSDIHLEFYKDRGRSYLDSLDCSGVDILVLAGDICSMDMLIEVFQDFSRKYPHVVYVAGNHELYGHSFQSFRNRAQKLPDNVYFLDNCSMELEGIHFVGTTLWFSRWQEMEQYTHRLSDFHHIEGFAEQVFEENRAAIAFLEREIRSDSVVVTHHLPTSKAVPKQFLGSPLTGFFLCDMSHLPIMPRIWMFGHTHWHVDVIGERGTRFLANPRGYPKQIDIEHVNKLVLSL